MKLEGMNNLMGIESDASIKQRAKEVVDAVGDPKFEEKFESVKEFVEPHIQPNKDAETLRKEAQEEREKNEQKRQGEIKKIRQKLGLEIPDSDNSQEGTGGGAQAEPNPNGYWRENGTWSDTPKGKRNILFPDGGGLTRGEAEERLGKVSLVRNPASILFEKPSDIKDPEKLLAMKNEYSGKVANLHQELQNLNTDEYMRGVVDRFSGNRELAQEEVNKTEAHLIQQLRAYEKLINEIG